MQGSIPEEADISTESEGTFELYGEDARQPGTYAANCLLARRLIECDVRFVQLYHQGRRFRLTDVAGHVLRDLLA